MKEGYGSDHVNAVGKRIVSCLFDKADGTCAGKNTVSLKRVESVMGNIAVNKIRCKKCGDIIESKSRYDFKYCKCKSVAVDGGHDYLRRVGEKEDWEELSEYKG